MAFTTAVSTIFRAAKTPRVAFRRCESSQAARGRRAAHAGGCR